VDLYPRSLTAPSPAQKLHDINPGIAHNGLFWTVPMPDGALTLSPDGLSAAVRLRDLPVQDQPNFGADTLPTYAARLDLDMSWQAHGPALGVSDPKNRYQLQFHLAIARIAMRITVPATGFTFLSDPAETSQTIFAMIGHDQNGVFF